MWFFLSYNIIQNIATTGINQHEIADSVLQLIAVQACVGPFQVTKRRGPQVWWATQLFESHFRSGIHLYAYYRFKKTKKRSIGVRK